ncbi:hypothetical protein BXZ70DRAFT_938631 [Cristinia sonorae]|uniref:Uncharacterized protein n=1 Tax=Cristinia sonorae TaxID=1940300 RepID=A0A8K0UNN8_9AGAR|nr:hypothetical protein BXZ70DRAFT_938631 [Cristinia sonorae]
MLKSSKHVVAWVIVVVPAHTHPIDHNRTLDKHQEGCHRLLSSTIHDFTFLVRSASIPGQSGVADCSSGPKFQTVKHRSPRSTTTPAPFVKAETLSPRKAPSGPQ